ncbi:hypothetical protein DPV73_05050 [Leptospira mayottensis]|nr:hypothetical protein DPV73_05050 [Leptospira mayottensis]
MSSLSFSSIAWHNTYKKHLVRVITNLTVYSKTLKKISYNHLVMIVIKYRSSHRLRFFGNLRAFE